MPPETFDLAIFIRPASTSIDRRRVRPRSVAGISSGAQRRCTHYKSRKSDPPAGDGLRISYVAAAEPSRRYENLLGYLKAAGCVVRHFPAFTPDREGKFEVADPAIFENADGIILDLPEINVACWQGSGEYDPDFSPATHLHLMDNITSEAIKQDVPFAVAHTTATRLDLKADLDRFLGAVRERE